MVHGSVLPLLEGLAEVAAEIDDADVIRSIAALREHAMTARLQIVVLGMTGAGRASTVNALLGCPHLLPASAIPKAPVRLVLRHGDHPAVETIAMDGARSALPSGRLRDVLLDPHTAHTAAGVDSVEVRAPCDALQTCDVRIEALEAHRAAEEWRAVLSGSDFVIVVLKADALLSSAERSFLRDGLGSTGLARAAIVVNRMDLVSEEEREELLDMVRVFLGPFEAQPVILPLSAPGIEADDENPLRVLLRDLTEGHAAMRSSATLEGVDRVTEDLAQALERKRGRLSLAQEEADRARQTIAARRDWLRGRIERAERRVDAFVGTILREQLQQEILGFGEVFRRRLPDEMRAVGDISTIRRYLPGYMETVWRDALTLRMIPIRSELLEEARRLEAMVEADLGELIDDVEGDLRAGLRDFTAGGDRLRAFVLPRRGKHFGSSIARGLSLHAFAMLLFSSFFGLSPVTGLLSLAASHVIRRIFSGDIEAADREAMIASALAASREMEREMRTQIDRQFADLVVDLKAEVASQYEGGVSRIEEFLRGSAPPGVERDVQRERLRSLAETTLPGLRARAAEIHRQDVA